VQNVLEPCHDVNNDCLMMIGPFTVKADALLGSTTNKLKVITGCTFYLLPISAWSSANPFVPSSVVSLQ
jgi:hypothetical protein